MAFGGVVTDADRYIQMERTCCCCAGRLQSIPDDSTQIVSIDRHYHTFTETSRLQCSMGNEARLAA
jgi:hypothetical protein